MTTEQILSEILATLKRIEAAQLTNQQTSPAQERPGPGQPKKSSALRSEKEQEYAPKLTHEEREQWTARLRGGETYRADKLVLKYGINDQEARRILYWMARADLDGCLIFDRKSMGYMRLPKK